MNPTMKEYEELRERIFNLPEEILPGMFYAEELRAITEALLLIGRELNGIRARMQ